VFHGKKYLLPLTLSNQPMKKIITAFIFCFLCGECFPQAGEWVWVSGDNALNATAVYGTQGIPSTGNHPQGLYEPCEWADQQGNFWLYGGCGTGLNFYSDLWKYSPTTNEWTWVKGSAQINELPNYGVLGIPSPTNTPGSRSWGTCTWVDTTGNLWLFGGAQSSFGSVMNDLWKYSISSNQWTWMSGNTGYSYGTLGVESPLNMPPGRMEFAASWSDNQNTLWFYGGTPNVGNTYGDLWKYSISSGLWTWQSGSNSIDPLPVYGTQGLPSVNNTPGGRFVFSKWKDAAEDFWLFAGSVNSNIAVFNDLWKYNPMSNEWTWMNGPATPNDTGAAGAFCDETGIFNPASRTESRFCWQDDCSNFWLYGGVSLDTILDVNADLWKYDITLNKWVFIDGTVMYNISPIYGTQGIPDPANQPGSRFGGISWKDISGNFWLFGGRNPNSLQFADLWKYTPDTACGGCLISTGIEISFSALQSTLIIFPNPVHNVLTFSFESAYSQSIEISLYNTLGKQIYVGKSAIMKGKFKKEINVEKWTDGIYFLQVKMKEGVVSKKVMVQH
jgi:hypothetical protein